MRRRLVRCVPQLDFMAGAPPSFLYTSGRPNRFNPSGVNCLYFSETERTANAEYRQQWRGTAAEQQPKLTFYALVNLQKVLDFSFSKILSLLAVDGTDLFGPWRLAPQLTRLQQLGLALSRQYAITAIRYPSCARHGAGRRGWNVAIFPEALRRPDRVEILGKSDEPLEELPPPGAYAGG
jgi:RES domain-containing protein